MTTSLETSREALTSGTGTAFPTAETTGVPPGTALADYDGPTTITTDGTVIDGVRFPPNQPTLKIQAANVTIRNSRFEILGYHCVSMDDSLVGTASLTIENCEFVGPWSQPDSGYDDLSCTVRGSGWSMYGCHIHGYGDGVHPDGDNIIQGNLMDDFGWSRTVGEHVDGSQSLGGTSKIHFIGNSILVQLTESVAGAIQFGTEYGGYDDLLLQGNQLAGGAWVLYAGEDPNSDPPVNSTNVRVVDNLFSQVFWPNSGANGVCPYWNSNNAGNQWSGNTFSDGTVVPAPDGGTPIPPEPPPTGQYTSIFTDQVPDLTDHPDTGPLSLGTRFLSTVAGQVGGVRVYAPEIVVGDGEVSLWDVSSGSLLASVPFGGSDLTGGQWNDVLFDQPLAVRAEQLLSTQVYWASETPRYVATRNFFSTAYGDYVTSGSLSAVDSSGRSGHINGVFSYNVDPVLASGTLNATSYFVDTLFAEGDPAQATTAVAATQSASTPTATSNRTAAGTSVPAARGSAAVRATELVLPLDRRRFEGLERWAARQGLTARRVIAIAVEAFLADQERRGAGGRRTAPIAGRQHRHPANRVGQGIAIDLHLTRRQRSALLRLARAQQTRVGQIVLEALEEYLREHSTDTSGLPT